MEEKIKKLRQEIPPVDVTSRVMSEIDKKDIHMRGSLFLLARKLGLQSVLMLAIFGGGLLAAMIFYLLKKMGALSFLKLGIPGAKVFLLSLPYDYIALLLITIILANYIVRKLDITHAFRGYLNISALIALVVVVFFGGFFTVKGVGNMMKDWHAGRSVPKAMAVTGRVISFSGAAVIIEENDGNSEIITFQRDKPFPYTAEYSIGKFLHAVGQRDPKNPGYFHATDVSCCEAE